MSKKNLFEDTIQAKAKKLKLAKASLDKVQDLKTKKVSNAGAVKGLKVFQTNKGVKVVNSNGGSTTIVLKTNYAQTGFNYKTGKTLTAKQVGNHAAQAIKYIERESASKDLHTEHVPTEELSHLYGRDGELLTHEEHKELINHLEEGIEAFRRFEFSPGVDMSREELVEAVSNALNTFNSDFGKNIETHFAVHTNTDHIHAHIFMEGSKSDIAMSKEQLQSFKVNLGIEVAAVLNEKSLSKDFDKDLEKEIHRLDKMKDIQEIKNELDSKKNEIKENQKEELKKEFVKQTKDLKIDKSELVKYATIQKAEGAKIYAERNGDLAKANKMEEWKKSIFDTLNSQKLNDFDKALDSFKNSNAAINIAKESNYNFAVATKEAASKLKDLGFSKAADNLISKQREENLKNEKIDFSKDLAINSKLESLKEDSKNKVEEKEKSLKIDFGSGINLEQKRTRSL